MKIIKIITKGESTKICSFFWMKRDAKCVDSSPKNRSVHSSELIFLWQTITLKEVTGNKQGQASSLIIFDSFLPSTSLSCWKHFMLLLVFQQGVYLFCQPPSPVTLFMGKHAIHPSIHQSLI